MLAIIKNEWKGQLRNRLMLFLGGFCFVITIWVTFLGQWQVERQGDLYTHAKEHMREQWDGMGDSNPHNAVHFGTFAFKPYGFLSSIDALPPVKPVKTIFNPPPTTPRIKKRRVKI